MGTPIVFASAPSNPGSTGSTLSVTLSTHALNDILIFFVENTGNTAWGTDPSGWTRLDQRSVGTASTGIVQTWFYHQVVSGDSLPLSSPSCSLGATVTRGAICWTVRNADLDSVFTGSRWGQRGFATGTSNPITPPSVTTPTPQCLALIGYGSRSATDAPEQTSYSQDQEIIISGTLVLNGSERTVNAQGTVLSSQNASPTSGVRWAAGIICIPYSIEAELIGRPEGHSGFRQMTQLLSQ